jgi:hypothetical protein
MLLLLKKLLLKHNQFFRLNKTKSPAKFAGLFFAVNAKFIRLFGKCCAICFQSSENSESTIQFVHGHPKIRKALHSLFKTVRRFGRHCTHFVFGHPKVRKVSRGLFKTVRKFGRKKITYFQGNKKYLTSLLISNF